MAKHEHIFVEENKSLKNYIDGRLGRRGSGQERNEIDVDLISIHFGLA